MKKIKAVLKVLGIFAAGFGAVIVMFLSARYCPLVLAGLALCILIYALVFIFIILYKSFLDD